MNGSLFPVLLGAAAGLFGAGLWCLFSRTHLVRMVLGLELLGKAVTLVLAAGGLRHGDMGNAQAMIFTLVVVEAVVAAVALALVIRIRASHGTLDAALLAGRRGSGGPEEGRP
ncbi:MAG: NADH-quinone oxidoreductase subunit K [Planctomycetaceae bacterium]|nr:NADH-quinone oxidoreductase subunit K [Planctomycetaceae bacterium]